MSKPLGALPTAAEAGGFALAGAAEDELDFFCLFGGSSVSVLTSYQFVLTTNDRSCVGYP